MADLDKPLPNPLDESLYALDGQALEFMKTQTGIEDAEELKKHIINVQTEAYAVSPHRSPCFVDNPEFLHRSIHTRAFVALASSSKQIGFSYVRR